jgi:hypothetical protein
MTFEEKNEINKIATHRYSELMEIGKHGHYESMYKVIHEFIQRGRAPAFSWADNSLADLMSN